MKKNLKKLYKWLIVSSADPQKTSLTIKGALVLAIPQIVLLARLAGIEIEETLLLQNVEQFVTIVGAGLTIFGLVRKIAYTSK